MAQESLLPQQLMTGALLHFESGVPICDVNVRTEHKERLARVDHVFWLWKKNPMLDTAEMFRSLLRQGERQYADRHTLWHAAQKDQMLFDFIVERVQMSSRKKDEMKVRWAADQMLRIGAETDNVTALDKGSKRLQEVAHLNEPESEHLDMSKAMFIPPVVTTSAHEIDETKEDVNDQQSLDIMRRWNAHIDEKREMIEQRVATMEARSEAQEDGATTSSTTDESVAMLGFRTEP